MCFQYPPRNWRLNTRFDVIPCKFIFVAYEREKEKKIIEIGTEEKSDELNSEKFPSVKILLKIDWIFSLKF